MKEASEGDKFIFSLFTCPICGKRLIHENMRYYCESGHSFDTASEGYVHLLPANRKHSKLPGDDKNMVRARRRFLSAGYYAPLRETLENLFIKHSPYETAFLDSGCGEGYYSSGIIEALTHTGRNISAAGIDISKEAVRLASKRVKTAEFAVASAYHLPLADGSVDIVLNCFSPLCENEFLRVLRRKGKFIYVVPAPRHLWELKCAVYDEPYENERLSTSYAGFSLVETEKVSTLIKLKDNQSILDLFTMTPYFWKTPKKGADKLKVFDTLETEVSFDVHVYEKD